MNNSPRTLRNVAIAAAGLSLPLIASLFWLATTTRLEEPVSSIKTPNPTKAPIYFLGPADLWQYLRNRPGGEPLPRLYLWQATALGLVFAVAAWRNRPSLHRPWLLFAGSLTIGTLLTAPWWLEALRAAGH